ncbi:crotonase/enoyl-CoA hydratase family protein [Bradyrhizobium sp. CER78]|uniref:crotonase/enoyl-CoA hydratase family protein n=1 Tax=Bradyrhizobium sp. CER78 TaxID=3039162 RepID=UPI0024489786|nr:crotonase/enoyl-CoA hydratase family protein [Bradyrhizobium sp. CER78]MDH2382888.1 crotonase/enoyl-CoA hydratase family protein [Bradyrhizobium sp. CER78]
MPTDRISLSIAGGVADVRLNRPDKLNALDPSMFTAIADIGAQLADNSKLRAVVLSGEGQAFCAGLDLERLVATTEGESILPFADLGQRTHGIANFAQHLVWLWRELPMPVIAAVHGIAFGGGFQLMLGADIRYLAPATRLAIIEAKWGLVPDMAGTQLMRHLAREDVVRELTYTARVFSADEALGYGFATRIVEDPRAAALETARAIADRSPDAIRAVKRLLNLAADRDAATGLAAETAEQALLLGAPNHIEAVRANLERRPPQWRFA